MRYNELRKLALEEKRKADVAEADNHVYNTQLQVHSLCCVALCCVVLCCVVLRCVVLCGVVLSCLVLSCLVLFYFILCCRVLSCLVLSCLGLVQSYGSILSSSFFCGRLYFSSLL